MAGRAVNVARVGRRRRLAGWVLLALGVVVAGLWVASRWWTFGVGVGLGGEEQVRVHVGSGRASVLRTDLPAEMGMLGLSFAPGFAAHPTRGEERTLVWRAMTERMRASGGGGGAADTRVGDYVLASWFDDDPSGVYLLKGWLFALWPLVLVMLGGGAWLVWSGARARRRADTARCAGCGYSLAGLAADSPCPECGKGAETK